jgi:guanylate kinase
MGHIYAIAGPSGIGKTTLLKRLWATNPPRLKLLLRSTSRPPRPTEREGIDYNFYSTEEFLHRVSSNYFVHVETYIEYFFGIERTPIENVISDSENDGIVIAGIYGALRLQEIYKESVTVLYVFSGGINSLLTPDCLEGKSPEIKELIRRLDRKHTEQDIEPDNDDRVEYIDKRMRYNYACITNLRVLHWADPVLLAS